METIESRERQKQAVIKKLEGVKSKMEMLMAYKADPDSYQIVMRGLSISLRRKKIPTAPIRH